MDEYEFTECRGRCMLSFCRRPRTRYIYGLLDRRNNDIFYVGSTFYLYDRFNDHLKNNQYVEGMLERGLFPLPLILLEFTTVCDGYSRQVEHDVALQLRAQGYSAFGDDTMSRATMFHWFDVLTEEQAHQFAVLCEMWNSCL